MPPKRRLAASAAAADPTTKAARPSKLAKENKITAQEEAEIKEAFSLFAEPMDGEKEGVMPIGDVRRALIALGIPPSNKAELSELTSVLDPDDEGFAPYAPFVAVCALKLHARDSSSEAHARELDEAFSLFTGTTNNNNNNDDSARLGNDADGNDEENSGLSTSSQTTAAAAITMAHLKRVAALLKEDVADDLLKDMILEANGGAGLARGVRRDEFDAVMRRAGVWR